MASPGGLITGEILHTNDRGTTTIKTPHGSYLLYNHTIHGDWNELPIRVITTDHATLAGYGTNTQPEKQGFQGEIWATVVKFTDDGGMLAVVDEGPLEGETIHVGKLCCTIGTYVPVIPFKPKYTTNHVRRALCTDPSVHTGSYIVSLREDFGVGMSELMTIRKALKKKSNLTGFEPFSTEEGKHEATEFSSPPTKNNNYEGFPQSISVEVLRISNSGNSIAEVDGEELNLGKLDVSPEDSVPAIPLAHQPRKAICIDPDLWGSASYLHHAKALFDTTESYTIGDFLEFGTTIIRQHANPHINYELPDIDYIATHLTTRLNTDRTAPSQTSSITPGENSSTENTVTKERYTTHTPSEQTPSASTETNGGENKPELTEPTSYTETRRRSRDQTFAKEIKDAYDNSCAVCGQKRIAPNGSVEVEAAHIYPKSEGGVDDVQNGIALCKLHHWAFDNGWISVSDSYEIIVRGAQNLDGYDELNSLDGSSLNIPDEDNLRPHPKFFAEHRSLHKFENE